MAKKKPRIVKGKSVKDMNPCALVKQRNTQLHRMIANTIGSGNEHAYTFCYDRETGKLYSYGECSGDSCSVEPKYCPAKDAHIGINHSHPETLGVQLSIHDITSGFATGADFDCLYSILAQKGICLTYKDKLTPNQKRQLTLAQALEKEAKTGKITPERREALKAAHKNAPRVAGEKFCSYTLTKRTQKLYEGDDTEAKLFNETKLSTKKPKSRKRKTKSVASHRTRAKNTPAQALYGISADEKVDCVYATARNNIVFCLALAFKGQKRQMCPYAEKNTEVKCPYGYPVPPGEYLVNMNLTPKRRGR